MKISLHTTKDGSMTLYSADFCEHYHSVHGAEQESMHVFIRMGLEAVPAGHVRILELGMGTGLNVLLTLRCRQQKSVHYTTLEKFPLCENEWGRLMYSEHEDEDAFFRSIHQAPWYTVVMTAPNFEFMKRNQDFLDPLPEGPFDLIYFDAFSPDKQPDLWTAAQFARIKKVSSKGAIMVTYCSKGQVRRNMIEAGWKVEKLPGPPGKREMLRARNE